MEFKDRVIKTIEKYGMFPKFSGVTRVLVGFSGGADSTALLTVLNSVKEEYNLHIVAAHVNHGLRGDEARRDEDFAVSYCEKLGIECKVLHADIPKMARERGLSFETCGRNVRYDFFKDVVLESLGENERPVIATAHNAQDVAETVIFNMARGSGLRGLSGIPPVRFFDDCDADIAVVRPIIECTRAEIEAYLDECGVNFVTDSTNNCDEYARNSIRHNVLPELEKINSKAVEAIGRMADSLRDDEECLNDMAIDVINEAYRSDYYDLSVLGRAYNPVLVRAIRHIVLKESGVHLEKKHTDEICERIYLKPYYDKIGSTGRIQIPSGDFVVIKDNKFFVEKASSKSEDVQVDLNKIELRKKSISEFTKSDKHLLENALDYDKINGKLIFRTRKEGDRFRPPYRHISKSLKSLFNELQIPVEKRPHLAILEDDGVIAWIEGIGPADGYTVTKNTKEVLYVSIQ